MNVKLHAVKLLWSFACFYIIYIYIVHIKKWTNNKKKFKKALLHYFHSHSFYSTKEFFTNKDG
jgi:hypothetical protein